MPARKRREKREINKKSPAKMWRALLFLTVIFIFVSIFVNLKFKNSVLSGESKLSVVVSGEDMVSVYILDPLNSNIAQISIPAGTWVDVSRNLGNWRIGSVWDLGKNEGIGGKLLAETVSKNFYIPSYSWLSPNENDFFEGNLFRRFRYIISAKSSSLGVIDRLKIFLFINKLGSRGIEQLDLAKSGYLKVKDDNNGEYEVGRIIPQSILILGAQNEFSDGTKKVMIKAGPQSSVVDNFTRQVEVMGLKVGLIEKFEDKDINCTVAGDRELADIFIKMYSCKLSEKDKVSSFDLEISLGGKFENNY